MIAEFRPEHGMSKANEHEHSELSTTLLHATKVANPTTNTFDIQHFRTLALSGRPLNV